jgi:hypothetical protein
VKRALSFLALCSLLLAAQRAQAQTSLPDTLDTRTHPVRTLGEITLVNTVVWSYNRFIRPGGGSGFKVGWHSWNESFENGFDWDPNNFSTNQFAHPYHGGLYYNAARSNGYDYWASMGFAFVGSFQWEYFGETHHPSFNDWVNTSVGGTALGEITHRFGSRVRDNTATGSSRVWSEFGGFLIDPVGGFTRLIDGDAFKQMPNPADREEGARVRVVGTFGSRTTYEGEIPHADTTAFCAQLRFDWGDPFQAEFERPYDYFGAYVRINGSDIATLGQVDVAGMLMRKRLAEGQNSQHMFAVFQNYDYLNNRAFELGGQSATASLMSRFGASEARYKVNTTVGVTGILLGATKSDYANQTSRSYDYGPGYGARFRGALTRDDWELLRVSHEEFVIHSVNGNKGDHYLSISTAGVSLPVSKVFVLDAEYQLYLADRHYSQFPDVHQRSPQLLFGVKTRL